MSATISFRRRREAGVTLVELLIATFLLALILLAIAPLFITSVKSNYAANEYTSIHNIARDRLEQLMSLPFNDAQLAPGRAGPTTCRRTFRIRRREFRRRLRPRTRSP
jgi:Tfp pilus assembly protein PilV